MNKKSWWLLLLSVVMCVGLSSCDDDEDYGIGYDLAGEYGKTWYGDFGKSIDDEAVFSEITFYAGSSYDHGSGTEQRYVKGHHLDWPVGAALRFDWEIIDGEICMYYRDYTEYIYDYYVNYDTFTGYFGDGYPFEMYLDYRW